MIDTVWWSTHRYTETLPEEEYDRAAQIEAAADAYRKLAGDLSPLAKTLLQAMQETVRRMPGDNRDLIACIQAELDQFENVHYDA